MGDSGESKGLLDDAGRWRQDLGRATRGTAGDLARHRERRAGLQTERTRLAARRHAARLEAANAGLRLKVLLARDLAATTSDGDEDGDALWRMAGAAPVMTWVTGPDGGRTSVNRSWQDFVGCTRENALGDGWLRFVHPDDRVMVADHYRRTVGAAGTCEIEYRLSHRDGTWRWVLERGVGRLTGAHVYAGHVGALTDITERKLVEEHLLHRAEHDTLTELPDRSVFLRHVAAALPGVRPDGPHVGVLFVDVDHFKAVNDRLGHAVGDLVLRSLAHRLKRILDPDDVVARLSGDEFAVLLRGLSSPVEARSVAGAVLDVASLPFAFTGQHVDITVSVGVAVAAYPDDDPHDLLRRADVAMYRAKQNGRARHEVFDAELHASVRNKRVVELGLGAAIRQRQLSMHYQPIVSVGSGEITAVEALMRWHHPERGLLCAVEFIGVAEESGLIHRLGAWAIERACRQLRTWTDAYPQRRLRMYANLSAKQLDSDVTALVSDILERTGAPADLLCLEITETTAMVESAETVAALDGLKHLGVGIAIDDFGTGYSSLRRLRDFPVDTVKIDRSFVDGLDKNAEDTSVVAAIMGLADSLGLRVIAEGVETETQLRVLAGLRCGLAQGYLFSRPLPAADAGLLLANGVGLAS